MLLYRGCCMPLPQIRISTYKDSLTTESVRQSMDKLEGRSQLHPIPYLHIPLYCVTGISVVLVFGKCLTTQFAGV
jgi:hypothetical protein